MGVGVTRSLQPVPAARTEPRGFAPDPGPESGDSWAVVGFWGPALTEQPVPAQYAWSWGLERWGCFLESHRSWFEVSVLSWPG